MFDRVLLLVLELWWLGPNQNKMSEHIAISEISFWEYFRNRILGSVNVESGINFQRKLTCTRITNMGCVDNRNGDYLNTNVSFIVQTCLPWLVQAIKINYTFLQITKVHFSISLRNCWNLLHQQQTVQNGLGLARHYQVNSVAATVCFTLASPHSMI